MKPQQPDINADDAAAWDEFVGTVQKLPQPEEPPSAPIYIDEVTPTVSYKNIPNIYHKMKKGKLRIISTVPSHLCSKKNIERDTFKDISNISESIDNINTVVFL